MAILSLLWIDARPGREAVIARYNQSSCRRAPCVGLRMRSVPLSPVAVVGDHVDTRLGRLAGRETLGRGSGVLSAAQAVKIATTIAPATLGRPKLLPADD